MHYTWRSPRKNSSNRYSIWYCQKSTENKNVQKWNEKTKRIVHKMPMPWHMPFHLSDILWILKVIIMSATMDVDHFSKFFGSQVLYLEGRTHPINIHHRKSFELSIGDTTGILRWESANLNFFKVLKIMMITLVQPFQQFFLFILNCQYLNQF